jgi:single-strand DNA-binding protein
MEKAYMPTRETMLHKVAKGGSKMLNRSILIGRLTRDPDLRYTPNGVAVASFTLAVNRAKAEGVLKADFIPVVVWQKQAEHCANYIGKGSLVAVEGRIQVRNYENKEGKRVYVTEVVAENVRFLDKRGAADTNAASKIGHEVEFTEDDIPFW